MHAALQDAGKTSELLLLDGAPHAFQVDWRGDGEPARERGDGRLPRSPPATGELSDGGRPLPRDPRSVRARAARRAGRHLRPPVAAHAGARRVSLLLRARRRRARVGRRRQRVPRPACARTGRSSSATTIRASTRRRAGRRAAGRLLQRAGRACGSSWPSAWWRSRPGPTGRSSRRTAPTSAPGRREVARAATGRRTVAGRARARTTARTPGARRMPAGMTARGPRARRCSYRWNDLAERRRGAGRARTATSPRSSWRPSATTPSTTRRCRPRASWRDCAHAATASARCSILDDVRAGFRLDLGGSGEARRRAARPHLLLQGARQRLPDLRRARPRRAASSRGEGLLHRLVLDGRRRRWRPRSPASPSSRRATASRAWRGCGRRCAPASSGRPPPTASGCATAGHRRSRS